MARISRSRVRGIAIFVIFLALAYAGLTTKPQKDMSLDLTTAFKEPNNNFRDTMSLNKARIRVRSANIAKALKDIGPIVEAYTVAGERPHFRSNETNYGAYIFKVQENKVAEVVQRLSALGTIEEQKEIVDTALVKKKLSTEEAILASKYNERASLESVKSNFSDKSSMLNRLNEEIRQLEKTVDVLKQSDTTMLFVQMVPPVAKNVSFIQRFVIQFVKALVVIFVALILAYYGTKLMIYLLSLMGVKGLPSMGMGGGSSYGYGNYANRYYSRYGYGGSKRKVKRIYKGKPSTPSESGETKQEQETK